jgi:hypothetical protein
MEWTIQDLGALGEFVGAIAVVVTLAYLAVQIRQNTRSMDANRKAVVAQSARDIDLYIANWHLQVARDPELKRIMLESQSRDGNYYLEADEGQRYEFHCVAHSMLMPFQTQYFHRSLEVAHDEQHDYYLRLANAMTTTSPGWQSWWEKQREQITLTPGFMSAVDDYSGPSSDLEWGKPE